MPVFSASYCISQSCHPRPVLLSSARRLAHSSLPPSVPPVVTLKQRDRDSQVRNDSNCA